MGGEGKRRPGGGVPIGEGAAMPRFGREAAPPLAFPGSPSNVAEPGRGCAVSSSVACQVSGIAGKAGFFAVAAKELVGFVDSPLDGLLGSSQ